MVYDAPILRYLIRRQYIDQLSVLPGSFTRQDYGIALPSGSPRRESLNQALLESLQDSAWEELTVSLSGKNRLRDYQSMSITPMQAGSD